MDDGSLRLAKLAAHGANVQEGQIVLVNAELGHEELARAVATAAYQRGAKFVDVSYFDPHVKRARIEHADPDTLEFVPEWYGDRARQHADQHGARINLNGVTAPNLLDDLDKTLVGRDRLPRLKEQGEIVSERSTNWCAADFSTGEGLRHLPNLPTEEVFTTPDPERTEGHVTSTKPLVLQDGTIVRGLRVRFEGGTAVEIDADENVEALRARLAVDDAGLRLGELALVDRQHRIGPS